MGEGGSSLVYAARNDVILGGECVALKVLHPDLGLSEREKERFLSEAAMLAAIAHPGIVPLLASGELPDGRPFIAMPRLSGRTLASRIAVGPIPIKTALALFGHLASAVSAVHDAGLIHRDIKPENVFWLEPDQRLVLLDLGIARDAEGAPSTTTRAGLARGTPQYMAPERLFGQRASVRTDVYELGLLLYVMLVGRPPWTDSDPQGRLDPQVPTDVLARLPESLVKDLLDAMALDVSRRPESVQALALKIERTALALSDEPTPRTNVLELTPSLDVPPVSPNAESTADPLFVSAPTELHDSSTLALAPTELHATPRGVTLEGGKPFVTLPSASAPPPPRVAEILGRVGRSPLGIAGLAGLMLVAGSVVTLAIRSHKDRATAKSIDTATVSAASIATESSNTSAAPAASGIPSITSPSASASDMTSAQPSAGPAQPSSPPTQTATPPTTSSNAAPKPGPSAPAAPIATGSASASPKAAPPQGPMPVSCSDLITLFCTSGTPAECASWKKGVDHWRTSLPPTVVDEVCTYALQKSQAGLILRKQTPIPR